jgi:hypothetical protein
MERHERQAWFDKTFPDGVNVSYVSGTPGHPEDAQYFTPRIIVQSSDDEAFRVAFSCLDVPKVFEIAIHEVEDYGTNERLQSYLMYTDEDDVFWFTSHITDRMKSRLSVFEGEQPDLFVVPA